MAFLNEFAEIIDTTIAIAHSRRLGDRSRAILDGQPQDPARPSSACHRARIRHQTDGKNKDRRHWLVMLGTSSPD